MKFFAKHFIWIIVIGLFVANVFVFVSGVQLSDEIMHYDQEIKRYTQENMELEKKAFDIGSLQHAASMAADLQYTEKIAPTYLDNLKFAFNN